MSPGPPGGPRQCQDQQQSCRPKTKSTQICFQTIAALAVRCKSPEPQTLSHGYRLGKEQPQAAKQRAAFSTPIRRENRVGPVHPEVEGSYIVTKLVEGSSLAERLRQAPISSPLGRPRSKPGTARSTPGSSS